MNSIIAAVFFLAATKLFAEAVEDSNHISRKLNILDPPQLCIGTDVHFNFYTSQVSRNDLHLGGELRYENVGNITTDGVIKRLDLVVTNQPGKHYYSSLAASDNGLNGKFGTINVRNLGGCPYQPTALGCDNPNPVTKGHEDGNGYFTFTIVESETTNEISLDFAMFFFDIDNRNAQNGIEERLVVKGWDDIIYPNTTTRYYTEHILGGFDGNGSVIVYPDDNDMDSDNRASFGATTVGDPTDNPSDPDHLTAAQQRKSIGFKFTGVSQFEVEFHEECRHRDEILCQVSGGNILFSGSATDLAQICTIITPQPTSAPTPDPTSAPTPLPTSAPTPLPTTDPTSQPTPEDPTPSPTKVTQEPTPVPTKNPSLAEDYGQVQQVNDPEQSEDSNDNGGINGDPIIVGLKGQVFKFDGRDNGWYANVVSKGFQWNMQFKEYANCDEGEDMFVSGMSVLTPTFQDGQDVISNSHILILTTPEPIESCRGEDKYCLGDGTLHISFDMGKSFTSNPGDFHYASGNRVVAHNTYASCSRRWYDYNIDPNTNKKIRAGGRRVTISEKKPLELLGERKRTMINAEECNEWIEERRMRDDLFKQKGMWSTLHIETPSVSFHVEYRQSNDKKLDRSCSFKSLDAWMVTVSKELETESWQGVLGETKEIIYDKKGEEIKGDRNKILRGAADLDYEVDGPFGTVFNARTDNKKGLSSIF